MKKQILLPLVMLSLLSLISCSSKTSFEKGSDHDEYIFNGKYHWKNDDHSDEEAHLYFSNGECKKCNWNKEYGLFSFMKNSNDDGVMIYDYRGDKEEIEIPNGRYNGYEITYVDLNPHVKIKSLKLSDSIRIIKMADNPYIERITNTNKELEVRVAGFKNCTNFTGFDGKIGKFGVSSFANTALSHFELSEDSEMTSIPEEAFANTKLTKVAFNNIKVVDNDAFSGCTDLKKAVFTSDEASSFSLGDDSFAGCSSLTSFSFPANASSLYLHKECFKNCSSLASINLTTDAYGSYYYDGGYQFTGCTNLKTINSDKIKAYSPGMFDNSGIKKLKLGDNVTVYKNAFLGIEELEVPSYGYIGTNSYGERTPKSFDSYAFSSKALKKITFGEKLYSTYFSDYLFSMAKFETISVPDGIETLGENCFEYCSSLKSIILPASIKLIKKSCFKNTNSTGFDYNLNNFIYKNIEVFYQGDKTSWDKVEIESGVCGNGVDPATKEQLYFDFHNFNMFFYSESDPSDTSLKYWHYVDGVATKW